MVYLMKECSNLYSKIARTLRQCDEVVNFIRRHETSGQAARFGKFLYIMHSCLQDLTEFIEVVDAHRLDPGKLADFKREFYLFRKTMLSYSYNHRNRFGEKSTSGRPADKVKKNWEDNLSKFYDSADTASTITQPAEVKQVHEAINNSLSSTEGTLINVASNLLSSVDTASSCTFRSHVERSREAINASLTSSTGTLTSPAQKDCQPIEHGMVSSVADSDTASTTYGITSMESEYQVSLRMIHEDLNAAKPQVCYCRTKWEAAAEPKAFNKYPRTKRTIEEFVQKMKRPVSRLTTLRCTAADEISPDYKKPDPPTREDILSNFKL